jgi:hypothetical protein
MRNRFLLMLLILCLSISLVLSAPAKISESKVSKSPVNSPGNFSQNTGTTSAPTTETGTSTDTSAKKSSIPDLTGYWTMSGTDIYQVKQTNKDISMKTSPDDGATWNNLFTGKLNGNKITGQYANTPNNKKSTLHVSDDGNTMTDAESGQAFTRTNANFGIKSPVSIARGKGLGTSILPMPTYKFVLSDVAIVETRSFHEDTDWASFGVKVGNNILDNGHPQAKYLGDVNSGDHPIGIEVGPIAIPNDPNTPVVIDYLIFNGCCDATQSVILSAMSQHAVNLFGYNPGDGNILDWSRSLQPSVYGPDGFGLSDTGGGLCNGPVAADKFVTNGQQLAIWTANGKHTEVKWQDVIDSPWGCGQNSNYGVTWYVEKVS